MNTKFSLLLLWIFFFIPTSMVAIKLVKKADVKFEKPTESAKSNCGSFKATSSTEAWSAGWQANLQNSSSDHPTDDGKSHHFHFTRFEKRRHRYFFCFLSKFFLLILHVASLLFGYMHCLH